MKQCPHCWKEISDRAVKCKHCHEFLDKKTDKEIETEWLVKFKDKVENTFWVLVLLILGVGIVVYIMSFWDSDYKTIVDIIRLSLVAIAVVYKMIMTSILTYKLWENKLENRFFASISYWIPIINLLYPKDIILKLGWKLETPKNYWIYPLLQLGAIVWWCLVLCDMVTYDEWEVTRFWATFLTIVLLFGCISSNYREDLASSLPEIKNKKED